MKKAVNIAMALIGSAGFICETGAMELPDGIHLDGRLRYERADQEGLSDSEALTYRMRLSYETMLKEGLGILVEGEGTMDLQGGDYDPWPGSQGIPGHTVIADPQNLELNRLQLSYMKDGIQGILGRQRIIRNNARFIGNVGWRQNEQTFDAISIGKAIDSLKLYYAYLDAANRIFGIRADISSQRQFELKSHIIEMQYALPGNIEAGLYGYLVRIENSAINSSDTYGAWLLGSNQLDEELTLSWRLELADQSENHYSPAGSDFDLGYYHLMIGLANKGIGAMELGYEVLEGNGNRGFSTPLATLHAFNGFADVFLSTPGTGIEDLYIKATAFFDGNMNASITYHDFGVDYGTGNLGKEVDIVVSKKLSSNLAATIKAARFSGTQLPDVNKLWLQIDMKY